MQTLATYLALAILLAPPSAADGPKTDPPEIAALKRQYIACETAARAQVMSLGDAANCSVIYETLKTRAFGGDFHRLHLWAQGALAPRP
jgi:hypothetical protein